MAGAGDSGVLAECGRLEHVASEDAVFISRIRFARSLLECTSTLNREPDREALLTLLQSRFETHMHRHFGIAWTEVQARLECNADALKALQEMESTGGEPDVIAKDKGTGQVIFVDCSPESPSGRRSTCYDAEARKTRKENAPKASALEMAAAMGIELLTEEQYRELQQLGEFDLKTSSWIATPPDVRALGGSLFCDRRYDKVFVYHNGAQSYYAARGFRGLLRV